MRILIVEDDRGIAESVARLARAWELEAVCVSDFRDVLGEFRAVKPELVLLDIALPYFNGYYWCEAIRRESKVPILFISSAADNMNIVMAMNLGADDFITKPFSGEVLMAKIHALLRRAYDYAAAPARLEYRGATLDPTDLTLLYRGEKIELTKNEHRILLTLMEQRGKIVSRERLMEVLWATDAFVDENTLTVNVGRLRRKLESAGLSGAIVTKHGVGYSLGEDA